MEKLIRGWVDKGRRQGYTEGMKAIMSERGSERMSFAAKAFSFEESSRLAVGFMAGLNKQVTEQSKAAKPMPPRTAVPQSLATELLALANE